MSLHKQLIGRVLVIGGLVAAAIAIVFVWREKSKIAVDVSAYDESAKIFLAEANWIGGHQPYWFPVEPGIVKLAKRPHYFKLVLPDGNRTGLISVDDSSPLVLK